MSPVMTTAAAAADNIITVSKRGSAAASSLEFGYLRSRNPRRVSTRSDWIAAALLHNSITGPKNRGLFVCAADEKAVVGLVVGFPLTGLRDLWSLPQANLCRCVQSVPMDHRHCGLICHR